MRITTHSQQLSERFGLFRNYFKSLNLENLKKYMYIYKSSELM